MERSIPDKPRRNSQQALVLITFLRGIFSIALGIVLIIQPDKTLPILVNFMGIFWLMAGILSIRWGVDLKRERVTAIVAGVIGILAGLTAVSRRIIMSLVSEQYFIIMFGIIIILTGILHAIGGFRIGEDRTRQWSWGSFFLGIFEIILGVLLVSSPLDRGSFVYWTATIWALIGGVILIGDGLRLRALASRNK